MCLHEHIFRLCNSVKSKIGDIYHSNLDLNILSDYGRRVWLRWLNILLNSIIENERKKVPKKAQYVQ